MSAHNAIPYAGQFGGIATQMTQQFTELATIKKASQDKAYLGSMGGAGGAAAGAAGAAGGVAGGILKAVHGGSAKEKAQGGLDAAASVANAAGPFGAIAGAALGLISDLLSIKGPRQKRREERKHVQAQQQAAGARAAQENIQGSSASRSAGLAIKPVTTVPTGEPAPSFQGQGMNDAS